MKPIQDRSSLQYNIQQPTCRAVCRQQHSDKCQACDGLKFRGSFRAAGNDASMMRCFQCERTFHHGCLPDACSTSETPGIPRLQNLNLNPKQSICNQIFMPPSGLPESLLHSQCEGTMADLPPPTHEELDLLWSSKGTASS